MNSKTLPIPEEAIIHLLRGLTEEQLSSVFWKTVVEFNTGSLSKEEKTSVEKAKQEYQEGETVRWQDIK